MSDDDTPAEGLEPETDDAGNEAVEISEAGDDPDVLRAEIAALKEQMLRVAADAENTKRRTEREANDSRAYAIQKFARDLLGVADNLQRAMQHAPKDAADPLVKNLAIGLEMTEKELTAALSARLEADRPRWRQVRSGTSTRRWCCWRATAVAGGVLQVIQPGYELFGRLVRPALVIVAARGSAGAEAAEPVAQNPYAGAGDGGSGASVDTKA